MESQLSESERTALIELGRRGSGSDFDQTAMSKLFKLGLVEVRREDRRVVLTDDGRSIYDQLVVPRDRPR